MSREDFLPRVWGNAQLLAFSALDGETNWRAPFVGQTVLDPPGILFHAGLKPSRQFELSFSASRGGLRIPNTGTARPLVVGPDILDLELLGPGWSVRFRLVFIDRETVLGEASGTGATPCLVLRGPLHVSHDPVLIVPSGDEKEEHIVILDGSTRRFTISTADENQARRILGTTDISSLFSERLQFFHHLPVPRTEDRGIVQTFFKACAVVKANVESPCGEIKSRWTTPDRWPHRHMWLWDSAFHSLGSYYVDRELAKDCIRSVLTKQREDGFIPHTMAPDPKYDSNMTQPPLLAWVAWELYAQTHDAAFLLEVYPKISRHINWIVSNMDSLGTGLLQWEHPGPDSGMDNSPRFDEGFSFDAVDLSSFVANELEHLAQIARALDRAAEAERWLELRKGLASRIEARLWRQEDGFYYDRLKNGSWVDVMTVDHFMPLFAGVASHERAETLVRRHLLNPREFWTPFPVPSVSLSDENFELDMWRGPTWINYNYLIVRGLERYGYLSEASSLARRTIEEIARWRGIGGSIYEFYDPFSEKAPWELKRKGKVRNWRGDGIPVITDFFWSSSIFIRLVAETYGLEKE